jgi:predicted PurR-regulated permease PerM
VRISSTVPVRSTQQQDIKSLASILAGVLIVAALFLARDVLIPLALAVLISFVLAPLALALRRTGLPRAPAVIAVVALTFGAILGVGALGTAQISQLAEQLPQYQLNIRDKIRSLKSVTNSAVATQANSVIEDIGREIARGKQAQPAPTTQPLGSKDGAPVPVEIRSATSNPLKVAIDFLQPIISPLATTGLVVLFVIFILLQREDLRDRVIKLLGTRELHRTTEAMDEAASRLSRYFLLQTALNAGFGLVVGLGLWVIGVPSPLLWGIFTMLMRFVPYIGSLLAAVLPVALAAAVDPGWTMVLWTLALFFIGEPLMGHVVEPLVFGSRTGLSPVAIVVAATFWTWLWGPIGLILSTPLTLCLVLLGQYTTRLEFLHVLLGDQPPLTPAESFYQRLIAGDPVEIIDQAESQLKERSLVAYYDDVALPGLVLAQRDASSGELSVERQAILFAGVMDVVDGLSDTDDTARKNTSNVEETSDSMDPALKLERDREPNAPRPTSVLCVAGRGPVDHAAAALLVQVLDRAGVVATLGREQGPQGLAAMQEPYRDVPLVCISYVATARLAQTRFMVRRLRRAFPSARIVIGLWQMRSDDPDLQQIKDNSGGDFFALSLREATEKCTAAMHEHTVTKSAVHRTDISSPSHDIAARSEDEHFGLAPQGG